MNRNNFKSLIFTLIGLGLCAAVSAPAQADDLMYHGNFCQPDQASVHKIERNPQVGVLNVSTSTAQVQCPFTNKFSGNFSVKEVDVSVYDRNSATDITCTLYGVAIDGTLISQTSGTSRGSSIPFQLIVLRPSQGLVLGTMNMTCSIPGATNDFSYVTTYRLITQ
jgi:hypothetical protein